MMNKFMTMEMRKMITRKVSYISLGLAIVMAILAVLCVAQRRSCKKDTQPIDTVSESWNYLSNNSNLMSVLKRREHKWPQQTVVLDLKQKCVLYVNGNYTSRIEYKDVKKAPACKMLVDSTASNLSLLVKDYILIEDAQRDSIIHQQRKINKDFDDKDSLFSQLYNVLAGDTLGHIVMGKKDGKWHLYRTEDFAQYALTSDINFYKKLIMHHKQHPQEPLCDYLRQNNIIQPCNRYMVYYDLRHDQVIEKDNQRVKDNGYMQHPLDSLKVYSGWLNYKLDQKWVLISAQSYYQDPHIYFIDEPDALWMNEVRWTDRIPLPIWLVIVLLTLTTLFGLTAAFGLIPITPNGKTEEDPAPTSPSLPEPILCPIDEADEETIKRLKEAIETYKSLLQEKNNKIESLLQKHEEDLTNLKEKHRKETDALNISHSKAIQDVQKKHEEAIEKAKKDGAEQYKRNHQIEVIAAKADKWDEMLKITKSDKLQQYLEDIRKKNPQFAVIDSIRTTYEKATQLSKDFHEQVLLVFRELRNQTNKDLQWEANFEQIYNDAVYASQVRNRYEAVRKQVDALQRNKDLVTVMNKKSLDFLDRIALSVWSIEAMNNLLATFQTKSMPNDLVSKAQNDITSNLLQLFVARVFINDFGQNKSADTFSQDRQNELNKRIDKLQKEYGITAQNDDSTQEIAKVFDDAMDQIRGTDEFVNLMWSHFVDEFYTKAETNTDKAWFFEMITAMGYHTVDFVRRKQGVDKDFCPNYKYLLSDLDSTQLPAKAKFAYHDAEYSYDYTNRIYEWLTELKVKKLKALVGRQQILP